MQTEWLKKALKNYEIVWPNGLIAYDSFDAEEESQNLSRMQAFIRDYEHCLDRSCEPGHVTASAFLCNKRFDRVLLTLHAKLGKWLQLGGHVEGETHIEEAALREAREESGLEHIERVSLVEFLDDRRRLPLAVLPFDIDIHDIPDRKGEAAHKHFDVRFLFFADENEILQPNHESKALRWLDLTEAESLTQERSMRRQFAKIRALKHRQKPY